MRRSWHVCPGQADVLLEGSTSGQDRTFQDVQPTRAAARSTFLIASSIAQRTSDIRKARTFAGMFKFLDQ